MKDTQVYEVTFTHIYDIPGFRVASEILGENQDRTPGGRHSCLRHGYWCWKNAIENPIMAIKYIWWRIKHIGWTQL